MNGDPGVSTPALPGEGQIVLGCSFKEFPRGKGANQSLGPARLGAPVPLTGQPSSLRQPDPWEALLRPCHAGLTETDRVKKAQELGAGAYVRKPYIQEKIGLAIRRELDK